MSTPLASVMLSPRLMLMPLLSTLLPMVLILMPMDILDTLMSMPLASVMLSPRLTLMPLLSTLLPMVLILMPMDTLDTPTAMLDTPSDMPTESKKLEHHSYLLKTLPDCILYHCQLSQFMDLFH